MSAGSFVVRVMYSPGIGKKNTAEVRAGGFRAHSEIGRPARSRNDRYEMEQ
jgi:hypothetical protein